MLVSCVRRANKVTTRDHGTSTAPPQKEDSSQHPALASFDTLDRAQRLILVNSLCGSDMSIKDVMAVRAQHFPASRASAELVAGQLLSDFVLTGGPIPKVLELADNRGKLKVMRLGSNLVAKALN